MTTATQSHAGARQVRPSTDFLDRKPPFDLDAEQAVLGSIFYRPEVGDDVRQILEVGDFFDQSHRLIYAQLQAMRDDGHAIDVVLFRSRAMASGEYDQMGGSAYLYRIAQSVPNASHARYYARIVAEKARLRAIIDLSTSALRDAYEEATASGDVLGHIEDRLLALRDVRTVKQAEPLQAVLGRCLDGIQQHLDGNGEVALQTGFVDLDAMLGGGLRAGELAIVAARPSMGKSSFAADIALHAARQTQVMFSSIEMTAENLGERILSAESQISGQRVRNRDLGAGTLDRLRSAASRLDDRSLYIDDRSRVRVGDIAASARTLEVRSGKPVGLIVVDYLQNVAPDETKVSREQQVAGVARRLKSLAKDRVCPVLCVAQVNRDVEKSNDKRPKLSMLRESGSIEQDADVVMFVHREEYYLRDKTPESERGIAEIHVAKQRNGPCGSIELRWDETHTTFQNLADQSAEERSNYEPAFSNYNGESGPSEF